MRMCNRKEFEARRNIGSREYSLQYTQRAVPLTQLFYGIIDPIFTLEKKDYNYVVCSAVSLGRGSELLQAWKYMNGSYSLTVRHSSLATFF
jgi:hypothetical protein